MLPKIHIIYNETYDQNIHELVEKKHTKLAYKGGRLFARRLRKAVKPMLNRMLVTMETETGLNWKWPHIRCYVAHDIPYDFDDPMTIKVRNNMHDATETFFHELAHQLELQNKGRINMHNELHMKYKHEPKDTLDHIFSHAVLWKVYENVYGKARLQRIINGYKLWPEHYKGWQIVKNEGPNRILKAYIKPAPPLHTLKHKIERKLAEKTIAPKKRAEKPRKLFTKRMK